MVDWGFDPPKGDLWKAHGHEFQIGKEERDVLKIYLKAGWYTHKDICRIYAALDAERTEHPQVA